MRLSCLQWIPLGYPPVDPQLLLFDNVMTKFMINNRTDAWKTDVNLLNWQCKLAYERARISTLIVKIQIKSPQNIPPAGRKIKATTAISEQSIGIRYKTRQGAVHEPFQTAVTLTQDITQSRNKLRHKGNHKALPKHKRWLKTTCS